MLNLVLILSLHNSNIQNLKTDWTQNIQKLNADTLELFWGPDITYQQNDSSDNSKFGPRSY